RCVPQPFVQTGHPAWGDPVNHPWTTGLQMSYSTEAILWGNWIKENMADSLPVTVGALVMDNDFGAAYSESFEHWAEENPDVIAEFKPVPHDPAAATVTNEMTTIASGNPEVFISMTTGQACLLAIQEASNSGLSESAQVLFTPSVCKDPQAFTIPAGDSADGWMIVGGGQRVNTDPQYADDPYISFMNETLDAEGLDHTIGNYGTGFSYFAWPTIETLRIASALEGGLTRSNFILALHTLNLHHPGLLPGVSFAVNGADDAYFIEGSDFSKYDAAAQSWVSEGEVIDLNGSSANCAWNGSSCG
ncbi:MAG: hypothetical protein ACK5RL_15470, partial [Acidimicrobiales bacterium]